MTFPVKDLKAHLAGQISAGCPLSFTGATSSVIVSVSLWSWVQGIQAKPEVG